MRIHVLVEGQTEKIVFDELIAAELQAAGHHPSSSIVATKKPAAGGKFRGGVTSWHQLRSEILKLVAGFDLVSTMIDYYGFPADAPGMSDRPSGPASLCISHVEQRIADSVDCAHFRPFLVMHEIEAWCLLRLHILDAVVVTTRQRSRYVDGVSSAAAPRRWTMASTVPRRSGSRESGPTTSRRWTGHSSCGRLAPRPSAPHALGWTRGCGACSSSRVVDAEPGFVGSESFSLDTHLPSVAAR